jgi:hypothetical protein
VLADVGNAEAEAHVADAIGHTTRVLESLLQNGDTAR